MKSILIALWGAIFLVFPSVDSPARDLTMEARAAFKYLNQIREQAGMIPFKWNPILQRSSANHAGYLSKNRIITHVQNPAKIGYTGAYPSDRALREGYHARIVTENHSTGDGDSLASVDGLMGAIYHRFGFLDFSKDEIGIAITKADRGINVVYNMGNTRLNRFCETAPTLREGHYYQDFCKQAKRVAVNLVDKLEIQTKEKNPDIVVWPPKGGTEIPVVFYEEIPDPLPTLSVSGYPVSIQFNPVVYSNVKLLSFKLFEQKQEGWVEVEPFLTMQKSNDPNQKFSDGEFALFPLNRLEWGKEYQARARYQHDGRRFDYEWSFTTRKLSHPLFKIAAEGESLRVTSDKTYYVYIPPGNNRPFIRQLGVESPYSVQVNVDWEDRNTIRMSLSGHTCQPSRFQLDGGRTFTVTIAETDNQNDNQRYPKNKSNPCK